MEVWICFEGFGVGLAGDVIQQAWDDFVFEGFDEAGVDGLGKEFVGDGGATGREDGKLDLRHGGRMGTVREKRQKGSSGFLVCARESTGFMG